MIKDAELEKTSLYKNDPCFFEYSSVKGSTTHRVTVNEDGYFFELTKISGNPVSIVTNNSKLTKEKLGEIIDTLLIIQEKLG